MSLRLDGKNPLAYMGVRPVQPPQLIVNTRRPTTQDLKNFEIGTFWVIPTAASTPTNEIWVLIDKAGNVATWLELDSGGGSVIPGAMFTLLTADGSGGYGTNVGPGTAGQVLLSGDALANPDYITPTATSPLVVTTNAAQLDYAIDIANHALIVGDGSMGVTEIAASATSGQPLVSAGAAATPIYGTAVVAGGGTGRTSHTAYSVICGGTTTTAAQQSVVSVGTSGQVLTSNGAGALPSFQASGAGDFATITVQTFTSNGTYTPTAGMLYCTVEIVGGGGGGGSAAASDNSAGGGGGAGGYARKTFDAATIGASQAVTIGAGGAAESNGAASTLGALLTGNLGSGAAAGGSGKKAGGAGGTGASGDVNITGQTGSVGLGLGAVGSNMGIGGNGGNSPFGYGGVFINNVNGTAGTGKGSGGGGAYGGSLGAGTGGAGSAGLCIVTEFVS